jgi:hypothetical protein
MVRRRALTAALVLAAMLGISGSTTAAVLTDSVPSRTGELSSAFTNLDANLTATQIPISYLVPALAPGETSTQPFRMRNTDRLPLWYSAASVVSGTPTVQLTIKTGVTDCSDTGFGTSGTTLYGPGVLGSSAGTPLFGDPAYGKQTGDRTLAAGATEYLCIRAALPTTAAATTASTTTIKFTQEQTTGGTYVSKVKSLSPLFYYRLNDPDGNARDVANGRSGTYGGTIIRGTSPAAVNSDATSGYVRLDSATPGYANITDTTAADFSGGLTISAWVYPITYSNWGRFVEFGNGPEKANMLFGLAGSQNDGTIRYSNRGAAGGTGIELWSSAGAVPLGTWTHIAVTVTTGGDVTLYANGAVVGRGTSSIGIPAVTRTINYIGKPSWTVDDPFQGSMSEVAIWGKPLTATQIASLYAAK